MILVVTAECIGSHLSVGPLQADGASSGYLKIKEKKREERKEKKKKYPRKDIPTDVPAYTQFVIKNI